MCYTGNPNKKNAERGGESAGLVHNLYGIFYIPDLDIEREPERFWLSTLLKEKSLGEKAGLVWGVPPRFHKVKRETPTTLFCFS